MVGCGQKTTVYFLGPGCQQHTGTFSGGSTGGYNIIQQQNPLSFYLFGTYRPVNTQNIGPALCLTANPGLGPVVADFPKGGNRFHAQFLSNFPGQKFHLIVASGSFSPGTDGSPGQKVKSIGIFLLNPHSQ